MIGPLGSGKTQAMIAECLALCDHQDARPGADPFGKPAMVRKSRGAICRNTYRDLWDTTIKDWKEWTDTLPIGHFSAGNKGESPTWKAQYKRPDGTWVYIEVMFLAFDVPADIRKARGLQLSWVWPNEAKEMQQSIINMLFGRTGRYPAKSRQTMIFDSNAPDRDHWLGKIALKAQHGGVPGWWVGIQAPGVVKKGSKWVTNLNAENIQNLPKGYYANQVAGAKDAWVRQNLANEFVFYADGRPIHPDFNEQMHVVPVEPTAGLPLVIGIDFGRTPAAAIMQPQLNGQWYVLRELCTVNMGALNFGRILRLELNKHYPGFSISLWGDPAGTQQAQTRDETPFEMLAIPAPEGGGLIAYPAAPDNDWEKRITALDSKLTSLIDGQPAILFDPSCVTIIKGLAGAYQLKRIQVSGEDRYADKPDKGPESHACEATHYGLLGGGEGISLFDMDDGMGDYGEVESWRPDPSQFE